MDRKGSEPWYCEDAFRLKIEDIVSKMSASELQEIITRLPFRDSIRGRCIHELRLRSSPILHSRRIKESA